jgi:hypothetical protein
MVLALAGDYGVGKSTLAKSLTGYKVLSFGNYVREELIERLGVERDLIYKKPTPDYARDLLKVYGNWKRNQDNSYWSSMLVKDLMSTNQPVVIDDIRFKAEYFDLLRTSKPVTLIFIGGEVDTYENYFLYDMADYYLPKHPNINSFFKKLKGLL